MATGTQLNWLPLPGGNTFAPTTDQSTLLTILVVVATINAVNFIDGLDGLAAGIVTIAAVSFLIYYYEMARVIGVSALAAPALASAILIGVCLGFLPHNFHPARIFMGDTGRHAARARAGLCADLQHLLARPGPWPTGQPVPGGRAAAAAGRDCWSSRTLDLLLAVIRRTRAGQSPFAPDRKHLHHRLIDIGHSQRASVLVMYLWAAVFSGSVVWLLAGDAYAAGRANHHGQPVLVFVVITAAAVAGPAAMSMPWLRWWQRSG